MMKHPFELYTDIGDVLLYVTSPSMMDIAKEHISKLQKDVSSVYRMCSVISEALPREKVKAVVERFKKNEAMAKGLFVKKLTNGEKFVSPKERVKGFYAYCESRKKCDEYRKKCPKLLCMMEWLEKKSNNVALNKKG